MLEVIRVYRALLRRELRALNEDQQGVATVEYITLIVGVSLGALGALIALGPLLLALYRTTKAVLLCPLP